MIRIKWLNEFPYFIIGLMIFFFLATHSPNLEYDTPSYINFGVIRPPLYPLFISLFRWAAPHQFSLIIWTHGVLLFAAILYARYWLKKNFQIPDLFIFITFLFTLLTISFHFQLTYVQSEGITFPLFIVTFFLLIECFYQFSFKKISCLSLLVSLLVLARLQFFYLYAIFILLCLWYAWKKIPIKSILAATVILFSSMGLTTLIDHGYHYVKHGFFGAAPYSGLMVLVQTLYLADNNAASYFNDSNVKKLVQHMIDQRNNQHLNQDTYLVPSFKPSYLQNAYQAYAKNYVTIQMVIENTLQTNTGNNSGYKKNFQANKAALEINKILILHELKKNLIFLLWKFIQCMGGVPVFLFFIIIFFTSCYTVIKNKIREIDRSVLFIAIIPMITFLNAAIIAACNPDLPAYFCYSQFMLYCLAAFLATKVYFLTKQSY